MMVKIVMNIVINVGFRFVMGVALFGSSVKRTMVDFP